MHQHGECTLTNCKFNTDSCCVEITLDINGMEPRWMIERLSIHSIVSMDGISAGVDHNGNEPEHSVIITLLSFFLLPFH